MTIKDDSGNLLLHTYKNKIEGNEIFNPELTLNETGWKNNVRLNNAVQYLMEKGFVKGDLIKDLSPIKEHRTTIVHAIITDITHLGIDMVENQKEFKKNFGMTINLGLIQINWGKQES